MTAAPVGGVQMWAKPLSSARVAIFLLNPLAAPQALDWPLADVPRFPDLALDCAAAGCAVRDVWAQQDLRDLGVSTGTIRVALAPWASAFYTISAGEADEPGELLVTQALEQAKQQRLDNNPLTGVPYTRRFYELLEARQKLPAWAAREDFLRLVHSNQVTILVGSPGSGKSTQVPQILLDAGYHVLGGRIK
ncbi:unnamed protein product, partial [Prorocentrum cordatum]